jgi:hypothetical protein
MCNLTMNTQTTRKSQITSIASTHKNGLVENSGLDRRFKTPTIAELSKSYSES